MSITFFPQTEFGWRAVQLMLGSGVMLFINLIAFTWIGEDVIEADWFRMIVLPVYGVTMLGLGCAGGVYALRAIWQQQERALSVWGCAGLGVLVVVFLVGEMIFPH